MIGKLFMAILFFGPMVWGFLGFMANVGLLK